MHLTGQTTSVAKDFAELHRRSTMEQPAQPSSLIMPRKCLRVCGAGAEQQASASALCSHWRIVCVCLSMLCCLNVDLARSWTNNIVATDGAQVFGFGVSRASCDPSLVRRIAAHCAVHGHGIIPDGVDLSNFSIRAVTSPLHVPLHYDDFSQQICVRSKEPADAPTLEAIAVTLATRRVTRSLQNHGRRSVFSRDAQALVSALRKGINSNGVFKLQLQKIAALNLCADISVTYGCIPTSCNPVDPPTRGVKRGMQISRKVKHIRAKVSDPCRSARRVMRHLFATPARGLPLALRWNGELRFV